MTSSLKPTNTATDRFERFADYFVVCGLDESKGLEPHQLHDEQPTQVTPLQISYKANVLWHYPENDSSNPFQTNGIMMLCMPRGVCFKINLQTRKTKFHSFLQTCEDGTKIYGFVLTFYEKVTNPNILLAIETLFKMFETERISKSSNDSDKYSNLQSNNKKLATFHTFNKDKDTLHVSKSICLMMKKPFLRIAKRCLEDILDVAWNENDFELHVENYVFNVLYEIPSPPCGRTMKYISICGEPMVVVNPELNELPFFDYSMKEVLMTLGFANLVDLFTCMLLEHQILMLASDIHKLMLIAECLTTLFFPLLWQHVYVPVLPRDLRDFLDAPVPFIMGLYYESEEEKYQLEIPCEGNLCLLDIDLNDIQLPQEIPELPNRNELLEEIRLFAGKYGIIPPENYEEMSNRINEKFSDRRSSLEDLHIHNLSKGKSKGLMNMNTRKYSLPNSPLFQRKKIRKSMNTQADFSEDKKETYHSKPIPRLAAMVALAEKAGVNIHKNQNLEQYIGGAPGKDNLFVLSSRALPVSRSQQHDDEFNIVIREIFFNYFTQILVDYEHFVILPGQTKEDWLNNREHMQNFDKASFLSDQSKPNLPFMTLFVETQGFASLIDMKIMALWEDSDPRLSFFDKRIDKLKVKQGIIRSDTYKQCECITSSVETYVRRCSQIDHNAMQPRALKALISREKSTCYFPILDMDALDETTSTKKSCRVRWSRREKQQQQSEHILINEALKANQMDGKKIKEKLAEKVKQYMQDSKTLTNETQSNNTPGAQKTLSVFADKLLKECKIKTNRLVILKLGQEAVELGHDSQVMIGIEENTLIASLCDLLERVWSHGVKLRQLEYGKDTEHSKFVQRMRQSKSPLWSHLLAFYQKEKEKMAAVYGLTDFESISDDVRDCIVNIDRIKLNSESLVEGSPKAKKKIETGETIGSSNNLQIASHYITDVKQQQDLLARAAFMNNIRIVLQMKEIKTDTGYARAWTRLALEKKVLEKDLRILLSHQKILTRRYRDYAFIRTTDELEQFLFHLLSLSAVNFQCFTNGFISAVMTYKVQIVIGKQLGAATTGNTWIDVSGTHSSTGKIDTPKGDLDFRFQDKNVGILTSLRIGHDNSGLSPGWFVEYVTVTNEVTGQFYNFPCGRWLSRSEDDASIERLLIADMGVQNRQKSPQSGTYSGMSKNNPDFTKANTDEKKLNLFPKKVTSSDIQERVADAVNNLVKYFYKDSNENLTYLLCGERGICEAFDLVFRHGFKSTRLFGKKLFVWDFLEKVYDYFVNVAESDVSSNELSLRTTLCTKIQMVNTQSQSIGKDQKFQLIICLGLRDLELQNWFRLLYNSPVTLQMYESSSFLRNETLLRFLLDVLEALREFDIVLDKSITRGI